MHPGIAPLYFSEICDIWLGTTILSSTIKVKVTFVYCGSFYFIFTSLVFICLSSSQSNAERTIPMVIPLRPSICHVIDLDLGHDPDLDQSLIDHSIIKNRQSIINTRIAL